MMHSKITAELDKRVALGELSEDDYKVKMSQIAAAWNGQFKKELIEPSNQYYASVNQELFSNQDGDEGKDYLDSVKNV